MTSSPPGWTYETLGTLTANTRPICYGVLKPGLFHPSGIPLLRIQDLANNRIASEGIYYISRELDEEFKRSRLEGGEVLLSIQGTIGRTAIVPPTLAGANISRTLAVIKPDHVLRPKFLYFYFQYLAGRNAYVTGGTTRASLNISTIREMTVPLPPLPEQEQIVATIEEQFSRADAGVSALERVQQNLERMSAAVLDSPFAAIPLSQWESLSSLGTIVTGSTPTTADPSNYGDDLPFVTPSDFDHGDRIASARRSLSLIGAEKARRLPAGSVLATCIGATLGKIALATVPCATNQQINAIIRGRRLLDEYLFYCLVRPSFTKRMWQESSSTTMPILNKSRFSALEIPVVSLPEQQRIVEEITERMKFIDRLSAEIVRVEARVARMRSAVLASAFTGELVPQIQPSPGRGTTISDVSAPKNTSEPLLRAEVTA